MSKANRDFGRARKQADAQNARAAAAPGLEQALAEGAKALLARKDTGGNYAGKDFRTEADPAEKHASSKGSRKRHLLVKSAKTADAIGELSEIVGTSAAIKNIDPKRGSRARQKTAISQKPL